MTVEIEFNNEKKLIRALSPKDSIRKILTGNPYEMNRVASLLEAAGISTIHQLCHQDRFSLLRIGKIGEISIERIIHALSLYGYELEMTETILDKIEKEGGSCNHQDLLDTFCKDFKITKYEGAKEGDNGLEGDSEEPENNNKPISDEEQEFYDTLLLQVAKEEFLRTNQIRDLKVRANHAVAASFYFVAEFKKLMDSTLDNEE